MQLPHLDMNRHSALFRVQSSGLIPGGRDLDSTQRERGIITDLGRVVHIVIPFLYHTGVYGITGSEHKGRFFKIIAKILLFNL